MLAAKAIIVWQTYAICVPDIIKASFYYIRINKLVIDTCFYDIYIANKIFMGFIFIVGYLVLISGLSYLSMTLWAKRLPNSPNKGFYKVLTFIGTFLFLFALTVFILINTFTFSR